MLPKLFRKILKSIMRSYKFNLPNYDLPLRLRPWFLCATVIIMLILAFLGFTNFSHSLPLNDKLLHFICLCLATGVFYFIFDVEEDARRVWLWRHSALIFTGVICFFFGGIVSEFVQSLLPYKEFQIGDVAANLIGSSVGLWSAFYLERYYRYRREISRLYKPVTLDPDSPLDSDSEEDLHGTSLLPLHNLHQASSSKTKTKSFKGGNIRLGDVWDEREELFGIGDSDDDDDGGAHRPQSAAISAPPKILVTPS